MNAIESFVPGVSYYLNPTTKKMERTDKTLDYDAVMNVVQGQLAELKKNPVGQNTLTDAEICELAQKYDPQKMTQGEYDSFIRYLEEKGVLSKLETCDIGTSFIRIIPGYNGLTESVGTEYTQWMKNLADANGNAIQFAQAQSQVQVLGYHGQIQHGAYEKVLDILNQMNAARGGTVSSQTATALMGDLSSFHLAVDRVKSEHIQTL